MIDRALRASGKRPGGRDKFHENLASDSVSCSMSIIGPLRTFSVPLSFVPCQNGKAQCAGRPRFLGLSRPQASHSPPWIPAYVCAVARQN